MENLLSWLPGTQSGPSTAENKWKETIWENLGLCGTIKDYSEKCGVRFKWVQTSSEKVPIAEPCSFGAKERRMSVRDEYLRTSLGSPLIANKPAYELN